MRRFGFAVVIAAVSCLCVNNLYAKLCSFERITDNSAVDVAGQLQVSVSSSGSVYDDYYDQTVNKVTFMFTNTGSVASSITEIYFYDGSLFNMYSIDDSYAGVNFENIGDNTNPAELPGFIPDHSLVSVLSATEAENPESKNGVKPGEWVKIGYTLLPDRTFQDLVTDLDTGEVVIGVHVKSIEQPDGGAAQSDSFVSVPEPATLALLGLGGLLLRRRKK